MTANSMLPPYRYMLDLAIASGMIQPRCGQTTLLIWKDATHARDWGEHKVKTSGDVRIADLNSELLQMIVLPPTCDRNETAIVSAAFGTKSDLSDVVLQYTMFIKKDRIKKLTAHLK